MKTLGYQDILGDSQIEDEHEGITDITIVQWSRRCPKCIRTQIMDMDNDIYDEEVLDLICANAELGTNDCGHGDVIPPT